MISILIICQRIILKGHRWSFTPHNSYKGSDVLQWHGNLVGPMSHPWRWQFHRLNRSALYPYVIQSVYLETATIPCWDPVGVQDMFEKKSKYLFWNINPHTQHFLWRRIFLGYPYSRLMDAHIRISLTACDEHPLLVLKKSHSHPQRHNHPTFLLPFHSSWLLPSLQFQTCFKLETLPTSQQRQQNRWGRHSIHWPPMRHPLLESCSLTSLNTSQNISEGLLLLLLVT